MMRVKQRLQPLAIILFLSSQAFLHAQERAIPGAPGIGDKWKTMMTVAERKRDAQNHLLPLQSYDETIRRGMSFLLDDHLKWFKGPPETLLDEKGQTQMPWVYYSNLQQDGTPFPKSVDRFVSYPAFHHALLIRTFIGYWRYANDRRILAEAVKLADWNIAHSTPADWPYGNFPWSTFQEKKPGGFRDKSGLMPDKAAIMGLAYLQLHEATRQARFLKAAEAIAKTLAARQRPDGTWPFRVDPKTEAVIEDYTSSVIYAVMLFESLDKLNGNDRYRASRDKTWNWLVNGPIKTQEFRGFYEDIPASPKGRTNYDCLDTIRYLLAHRTDTNGYLEMAKDLNAWVEKTFMDKIKDFEPAEGIREQLQCNVVMGIHSLNWASMLLELSKVTGDAKLEQRARQTANYISYYLQPDGRIVVGFNYNQWWYSCHAGAVLYLLDFVKLSGGPRSTVTNRTNHELGRARAHNPRTVEANRVAEISFVSKKTYTNPFLDVMLDAVVTAPEGSQMRVPAFWAGDNRWAFRFAAPKPGTYAWTLDCSDKANTDLQGVSGKLEVTPGKAANPLYQHGPVRVARDGRHFEHADGTPFLWLADTWWKCLCKRMTWEGFQELTADRKAKGFSVVQIVCGPYPDEGFLEKRLENEGGLPYEKRDFTVVNPKYFDAADRRLQHLVDSGLSPAIVGAWGRSDCNSMAVIGVEGLKRHWRYLVARYAAYPVFWILAGEIPDETKWGHGQWGEVGKYLRSIDPYHRLVTCHTGRGRRNAQGDVNVIDFDMVGSNHDENVARQPETLAFLTHAYAKNPPMPVLVGEACYEGHMQQGFGVTQRHMFWMNMLSGAAGHTYGAAGVWHAGVEGDPGHTGAWGQEYDFTTWKEGMNYPGSAQLGRAKKLLEQYPWRRFEPHPEWAPGCYAAGIAGEVRFVYLPRRNIYNWSGPEVKGLEPDVDWHAYYWDPATGRKFDQGTISATAKDKSAPAVSFKKNVPSPQDWVLVLERAKP